MKCLSPGWVRLSRTFIPASGRALYWVELGKSTILKPFLAETNQPFGIHGMFMKREFLKIPFEERLSLDSFEKRLSLNSFERDYLKIPLKEVILRFLLKVIIFKFI